MEERLLPINGLLALLKPHDLTPPLLHRVGFRVQGLEVPVTGDLGKVVVDVVLFHPDHSLLVLCECKSGANVEVPQAKKYAAIDPGAVVNTARISLPKRVEPTAVVLYVCQSRYMARIKHGLVSEEIDVPIIGVSSTKMVFDIPHTTPRPLYDALHRQRMNLTGPVPRIIEFDQDTPVEAFESAVRAQLVAALAHRLPHISVRCIAEAAAPYLALYGHKARGRIIKRVGEAARKLATVDNASFAYQPPQPSDQDGGVVHLLKTPEDNDPRGRTQGYQALMRGGRARRGKAAHVDPDQLDLLRELAQADDEGGDDVVETGEGEP